MHPDAMDSGALNVSCQTNKKREQLAEFRPVHLAQIADRTAGLREGRAQLRPHKAVTRHQQRAQHPAEHRLRPVHRRDDQGNGDERPHPDHVDHVQGGGVPQADPANQLTSSPVRTTMLIDSRSSLRPQPRVAQAALRRRQRPVPLGRHQLEARILLRRDGQLQRARHCVECAP